MNLLLGQGGQTGGQALSELTVTADEHPLVAPQELATKRPLPCEQAAMGPFVNIPERPMTTHFKDRPMRVATNLLAGWTFYDGRVGTP